MLFNLCLLHCFFMASNFGFLKNGVGRGGEGEVTKGEEGVDTN
jgi:hypothetical protein